MSIKLIIQAYRDQPLARRALGEECLPPDASHGTPHATHLLKVSIGSPIPALYQGISAEFNVTMRLISLRYRAAAALLRNLRHRIKTQHCLSVSAPPVAFLRL